MTLPTPCGRSSGKWISSVPRSSATRSVVRSSRTSLCVTPRWSNAPSSLHRRSTPLRGRGSSRSGGFSSMPFASRCRCSRSSSTITAAADFAVFAPHSTKRSATWSNPSCRTSPHLRSSCTGREIQSFHGGGREKPPICCRVDGCLRFGAPLMRRTGAILERLPPSSESSSRHRGRRRRIGARPRPEAARTGAYSTHTVDNEPPRVKWGAGLHVVDGQSVNASAYEQYCGRWSRLFVPAVLAAADVAAGDRVLDVATGPGAAAALALSRVGSAGLVVGVDIAPAMLDTARARLAGQRFRAAAMDGQALAFPDGSFDGVICQLGLMFFPDPPRGLAEFCRVLRRGRRAAICVISAPERAPMWGILADTLSRYLPDHRDDLHLSFLL